MLGSERDIGSETGGDRTGGRETGVTPRAILGC